MICSYVSASPAKILTLASMKYTQHTLDKLEELLAEIEYVVRYERGTFQSGYCILEQKKVVVLNKFLQLEGRINTLIDIIPKLIENPDSLSPESRKTFDLIHVKA
jgi:hypothetical protein